MTITAQAPVRASRQDAKLSPLRVCHLSMTLRTGGLERLLVEFAKRHDASQFQLRFVALEELGPPAEELREAGFQVTSLELSRVGKFTAVRRLRKLFGEERIDILHTHNTYPHFYGALAARWAGVPTVINTQHGRGCGTGWKSLWQFRIANLLTQRIAGVSEDAAALCREQDPFSADRIACLWNGIDVERFRFTGPRREPVAISVARLSPEKDYATLLRAVQRVVADCPEFRLKLVGDGVERASLEALAAELGIRDRVEFLGERRDVPELLSTAGFYVSSSTTEGISLTLLEAMAVGLPIVTTRVGGNPEIVLEDVTGSLVPSGDPAALASAMIGMIDAQDLWETMGHAARDRVSEYFNVRKMVAGYEDLYRACHVRPGQSS